MTAEMPWDDIAVDGRLAAIVESSFDAIVSKDLNSIITSWNAAAERMFGYLAEEAIGNSVTMLIPAHLQSQEEEIISRIKAGERIASFETVRCRKDGTQIFVSLTISPIRNAHGVIVGASKIARDVTAAKENERRIKLLMREVNHRVKNQFSVILSMIGATARQTDDPRVFEARVRERIMALARSHDLLVQSEWSGTDLANLVSEHLRPFGHDGQLSLDGPRISLTPNAVQHFGMALHELGTNSAKYGAFAGADGTVKVSWSIERGLDDHPAFTFNWLETCHVHGGVSDPPDKPRSGLGTIVLQRIVPQSVGGSASVERSPGYVNWSLTAPLDAILMSAG